MKKIIDLYDKAEERVLVGSLVFTVILLFMQVIMRKVFNNSLSWSEELARYIFIWQIWLGISIGVRKKSHISVELIFGFVKGRGETAVRLLITLLSVLFCLAMVILGWQVTANLLSKNTLSPAMGIPLWIVYLSLPFSFFVTMLRHLQEPFELLRSARKVELSGEGE